LGPLGPLWVRWETFLFGAARYFRGVLQCL
jgi:hypothetical protein